VNVTLEEFLWDMRGGGKACESGSLILFDIIKLAKRDLRSISSSVGCLSPQMPGFPGLSELVKSLQAQLAIIA
jgi:hypothetical protein